MVTLKINGKDVQVEKDKTVLDAIQKAGISVPTLCYHKDLTGYGSCRLCQVEVIQRGKTKLVVSCLYPVSEGLEVKTHTKRVENNRRLLIELLLARSPDSNVLQQMAQDYKISKPRFRLKAEKCILCGLCTRVCSEILGANAITSASRGTSKKIEVPFQEIPETCVGCGACTYVCPTGAIQMETDARKRWALYLASGDRECRYSRMGIISHKICPNAFQCQRCDVDQRLEDKFKTHPAFIANPMSKNQNIQIDQLQVIPNRYYTDGHIWIKPLNGKFRIGIDDFAAKFIGKIDSISLEENFRPDKPVLELTVGSRKVNMLVPFSGKIAEINPLIKDVPSIAAKDPYQQGWIVTIKASNRDEAINQLLSPINAAKIVKQHSEQLQKQSGAEPGSNLMDDKGALVNDIPGRLSDKDWVLFTKEFFKSTGS